MINRKLGNVHALSVFPTFTRASTAYKEDGTSVASGVPRIESLTGCRNIVTNGDFSNGATGWSANQSTLTVISATKGCITGKGTFVNPGIMQDCGVYGDGHKYYVRGNFLVTNDVCKLIQMNLRGGTTQGTVMNAATNCPTANTLYTISKILIPTGGAGNLRLFVEHGYLATADSLDKQCYVDNITCIDLTAEYGAGNEPTLVECDEIFADYYNNKGVLIEEGTSNLLPSVNQNKLVNGTPNVNIYTLTTGLVQGGKYTLSGKKCVYADDAVTNPCINIVLYYSDGSSTNNWLFNTIPNDDIPHDFVLTVTADSAKTLTKVAFRPLDYSSGTPMHQECQNIIAEQKDYATSFTPTTRSAETLTIPSSALSVTEGTIEFDYTPINQPLNDMTAQLKSPKILQIGDYATTNSLSLWRFPHSGVDNVALMGNYISGWKLSANKTYAFSLLSKYRFSLRWKTANTFDLFINGVCIISNAISSVPFTAMGNVVFGAVSASGAVNAIYSNIRISNKARSDAELAYTGDLSVDYYTTYLLPCKTSLAPKNF